MSRRDCSETLSLVFPKVTNGRDDEGSEVPIRQAKVRYFHVASMMVLAAWFSNSN